MKDGFPFSGLSNVEAEARLTLKGPNELPQVEANHFWTRISRVLEEPMLLLLVVAGAVYLMMGNLHEGILLGLSVLVVIGISFYQDYKSEKALAALRELSSPRALVVRSGSEKRIAAKLLVPGDLVILHEGDRVPADGLVLQSTNLAVDESLLSGESFPATKTPYPGDTSDERVDTIFSKLANHHKVFSSTLVVSGTAFVRVIDTGLSTEVGKIGKSLQGFDTKELILTGEIRQIVRLFAWSGSLICSAIVVLYGMTKHQWIEAFLVGLATQMALLPEEFPVVLSIFLAVGAWRLSKVQVLVRRPGAIEQLGAVTVLCVDKTGTLTENRMTVAGLNNSDHSISLDSDGFKDLPHEFHSVAEFGVLASHRDPFDPMERAICRMVEETHWGKDHLHRHWELIRDYPLSDDLLAMSCVWKDPDSDSYTIASKGAPEAIADLCHLDSEKFQSVMKSTKEMATTGLRVIAVAKASFLKEQLPKDQHGFDFEWVGLIGFVDPLRREVPPAIQKCRKAGIRVMMMTGDYPETALNIASQAGLDTLNSLITGAEMSMLSDIDLKERLKSAHVFARMVPEQKLRIVKTLKTLGHVVAMTGDGVNDAPSLKWADVGVAMGARGTDVAREASDIVLLDDHFASIVSGIERGRQIFSNIKKAMSYIVSIHVPIAGMSILPVIFGWPLILLPVHIVFLELIIDPACSLLFESQAAEFGLMEHPPRSLNARLFSKKDLFRSLLQGLFILGVVMLVLRYSIRVSHDDANRTRALAFATLVMSNIGIIFADMGGGSLRQSQAVFRKPLNLLIIAAMAFGLLVVTKVHLFRVLFHFGTLSFNELIASACMAVLVFVLISLWNLFSKMKISRLTSSSIDSWSR